MIFSWRDRSHPVTPPSEAHICCYRGTRSYLVAAFLISSLITTTTLTHPTARRFVMPVILPEDLLSSTEFSKNSRSAFSFFAYQHSFIPAAKVAIPSFEVVPSYKTF
jgi:hypothetical protein